jgi:hypothetical protein
MGRPHPVNSVAWKVAYIMKVNPIVAAVVDQAAAHLGELVKAKIGQAGQAVPLQPPGRQQAEAGRPRSDPPGDLPRRAAAPVRRPDASQQTSALLLRALHSEVQPEGAGQPSRSAAAPAAPPSRPAEAATLPAAPAPAPAQPQPRDIHAGGSGHAPAEPAGAAKDHPVQGNQPGPAAPSTQAVSHTVGSGLAAAHEIAAMMAELSHAAALDSATKKSADQVKTAAQ